jgi:hypothetical protein
MQAVPNKINVSAYWAGWEIAMKTSVLITMFLQAQYS